MDIYKTLRKVKKKKKDWGRGSTPPLFLSIQDL